MGILRPYSLSKTAPPPSSMRVLTSLFSAQLVTYLWSSLTIKWSGSQNSNSSTCPMTSLFSSSWAASLNWLFPALSPLTNKGFPLLSTHCVTFMWSPPRLMEVSKSLSFSHDQNMSWREKTKAKANLIIRKQKPLVSQQREDSFDPVWLGWFWDTLVSKLPLTAGGR